MDAPDHRLKALRGEPDIPRRGEPVVCVTLSSADKGALDTLRSVFDHTDSGVPIVLAGPSTALEGTVGLLQGERPLWALEVEVLGGNALAALIRATAPADLVLVRSGIEVSIGWLHRLAAVASSESTVAAVTPFSLGRGGVKLDLDGLDAPLDELATAITDGSKLLRPRIGRLGPGCVYIGRPALELAAGASAASTIERELEALSVKMISRGLLLLLADDVVVRGPSELQESFETPDAGLGLDYREQAEGSTRNDLTTVMDEGGAAGRAALWARTRVERLSVTVDGRSLVSASGGTQTYTLEMICAVARSDAAVVRVVVPPDLSEQAAATLEREAVEIVSYERAVERPWRSDIIHRPQQIFTVDDLALLRLLGERIVVGHQDLISYHNYTYHRSVDSWRAYRRTTRLALAAADEVVFFSRHARDDALAEGLLAAERASVVGVGAESLRATTAPGHPPDGMRTGHPFLLCLGADYLHKNRPFAIALLRELRGLGWPGMLVLAGANVAHGSSREHEREILAAFPDLCDVVTDVGSVDDATREWLYSNAAAVVYPTVYEGYGLLPLEAARHGVPCLFAPQASLDELAGDVATLIPWDPRASARAVIDLLRQGPARERHLEQLRGLRVPPWREVADQLLAIYNRALANSPAAAAFSWRRELERERYVERLEQGTETRRLSELAQEYQDAYHSLEGRVGEGLPLIEPGGLLSIAQQRGLMRVASRRRLGGLLMSPFGLIGRLGSKVGHR